MIVEQNSDFWSEVGFLSNSWIFDQKQFLAGRYPDQILPPSFCQMISVFQKLASIQVRRSFKSEIEPKFSNAVL